MKRNSIKKISIFLITFVCMFLLTEKVKAGEVYKCRYNISYENDTTTDYPDEWISTKDLLFSFEYNNGTYATKLVQKNDPSVVMANNKEFAYVNRFFLNETKTLEDLKTWDFSTKKSCPSQLWIAWSNDSESYFGENIELSYGISFHQNTPQINVGSFGENEYMLCTDDALPLAYKNGDDPPCEVVTLDVSKTEINSEVGDSGGGEPVTTQTVECMYADSLDENNKDSIKFSFNATGSSAVHVDDRSNQTLFTHNIKTEGLTKCPKILYEIANEQNTGNDIYIERPTGNNVGIYYLKTTYSVSDVTSGDEEFPGCDALGPTKKYVVGIMNLIRFLVPVIIIVLSIIDFVGIVISGDNEKMEKAKKRFMIRLLVGVLILFVPFLIELLLRVSGVISNGQSIADIVCGIIS